MEETSSGAHLLAACGRCAVWRAVLGPRNLGDPERTRFFAPLIGRLLRTRALCPAYRK